MKETSNNRYLVDPFAACLAKVGLAGLLITSLGACGKAAGVGGKITDLPSEYLPSLEQSTLTVSSNNIADGTTATIVTATVKTTGGIAIPGVDLTLDVSGSNNTLENCTTTNSSGVSTCKVYTTKAETKTITVSYGSLSLSKDVTFTAAGTQSGQSLFIVTSGGGQLTGSGVGAKVSLGGMPDEIILRDSSNTVRSRSSIHSALW